MRRDSFYLIDIVQAAEAIERFVSQVSEEEFFSDEMRQSAVLQKLTVIGEAAARLSPELKTQVPDVPWTRIVGFRNVAVHAYFDLDWTIVWTAATEDAPALRAQVQALLEATPKDE